MSVSIRSRLRRLGGRAATGLRAEAEAIRRPEPAPDAIHACIVQGNSVLAAGTLAQMSGGVCPPTSSPDRKAPAALHQPAWRDYFDPVPLNEVSNEAHVEPGTPTGSSGHRPSTAPICLMSYVSLPESASPLMPGWTVPFQTQPRSAVHRLPGSFGL